MLVFGLFGLDVVIAGLGQSNPGIRVGLSKDQLLSAQEFLVSSRNEELGFMVCSMSLFSLALRRISDNGGGGTTSFGLTEGRIGALAFGRYKGFFAGKGIVFTRSLS